MMGASCLNIITRKAVTPLVQKTLKKMKNEMKFKFKIQSLSCQNNNNNNNNNNIAKAIETNKTMKD